MNRCGRGHDERMIVGISQVAMPAHRRSCRRGNREAYLRTMTVP
jgi:hypothetical protein